MDFPLKSVALIAGPTASGKSALALSLAQRHNGVVINADSAQVYADLRVLSARPSDDELAQAPHALYGHVDGAEDYSAARWAGEARAAIAAAHAAGQLPIVVGGTGLYLRTLVDGIAPVPEIDADIRAEVRALPTAEAHAELVRRDPAAAERLNAADTTRVARALEVVRGTGRTLKEWQERREGGIGGSVRLLPLILLPDREWLFDRCDRRVAMMLETGAVEEVEALIARNSLSHREREGPAAKRWEGEGSLPIESALPSPSHSAAPSGPLSLPRGEGLPPVPDNAPVLRAIGVAELTAWLLGKTTREEAVTAMRLATRQYAKRQYTWFRNQPPPEWPRLVQSQNIPPAIAIATLLQQ